MTYLCDCEGLGCSKCGGEGTYPMDDELTRLRAENERLRDALWQIAEQDIMEIALDFGWPIRIADAALKETSHDR